MKVVILAGGFGSRLSEETYSKPKPMVEIGGKPILLHIMQHYAIYGYNEFIVCLGYKGEMIKHYFANYLLYHADVTFDFTNQGSCTIHEHSAESWKVTLIDTGLNTLTGGRLKRVQKYIGYEPFMLTYGDGVGNINVKKLVEFHRSHGKLATITTTQPKGRFGTLTFSKDQKVKRFQEKIPGDGGWINAGFFVFQPEVFRYITAGDQTTLEQEPMIHLIRDGELMAYKHFGFWHPMDTLRDKHELELLWASGNAPWECNDDA